MVINWGVSGKVDIKWRGQLVFALICASMQMLSSLINAAAAHRCYSSLTQELYINTGTDRQCDLIHHTSRQTGQLNDNILADLI